MGEKMRRYRPVAVNEKVSDTHACQRFGMIFGVLALLFLSTSSWSQESEAGGGEVPAEAPAEAPAAPATPPTSGDKAEKATPAPSKAKAGKEGTQKPAIETAGDTKAAAIRDAEASYRVKIRGLEEKVNELKENIFRSKAKLIMLTEMVTGGLSTSAKMVIVHKDEMGPGYSLIQRHYFLDGMPLHQDADQSGERFKGESELVIFDGPIVEGTHTLTVSMVYRGNGRGIFSYLDGYTFNLKDSFTFTAEQGRITASKVVGFERGDFTTQYLDRPAIRFDTEVFDDKVEEAEASDAMVP